MGREVRMVPKDWKHPVDRQGRYIPLYDGRDYERDLVEWEGDDRPSPLDYMPRWASEEATHYMMYENTSEGTPISPAFATPEELARWLVDNGASAFAGQTASYEAWLATIKSGFAVSAVVTVSGDGGGFVESGVEALGRNDR